MADEAKDADVALAAQLHEDGWRQASVFQPPPDYPIPAELAFDGGEEYLVACTQSCSLVSQNFERDPLVEFLIARPVSSYAEDDEKATGKNVRRYLLPVSGIENLKALECDVNRRFFLDRRLLAGQSPDPRLIPDSRARRQFGGWLGRYYHRVALPNELGRRARQKLWPSLKRLMKAQLAGKKVHENVDTIYLRWTPDEEADEATTYELEILILCKTAEAQQHIEDELNRKLGVFEEKKGCNGIIVKSQALVGPETRLRDTEDFCRFSDWDYWSGLEDISQAADRS
ncbi:hypothetical protein [Marinimicrococcus flavescens]|uniref:Uncharacterized protein n=1 Tax=Marinimicrococcus flavescens TaxID=3031815 RepID=A0AAP3XR00_9PROT|nr:hypothetical protein [Marinimicrococcus flavescens]